MSDEKHTPEQLMALGQKLLARRERQALAQKRRREKLKAKGWTNLTLQVPESRIAEIKKIITYLSKAKSGVVFYLGTIDENGAAKAASEKFTMK